MVDKSCWGQSRNGRTIYWVYSPDERYICKDTSNNTFENLGNPVFSDVYEPW